MSIARFKWPFCCVRSRERSYPAAAGCARYVGEQELGVSAEGYASSTSWDVTSEAVYMLFAYSKNQQGDLTRGQICTLGRLVRKEFG